ncbi:hypothetical protein ON010_g7475 [Phytophthora cinnamomi]|nr:hypothetical protein ON010_g7475 [Phytophthora cinnamomi]
MGDAHGDFAAWNMRALKRPRIRGFDHIHKHVGRHDLWTMDQVVAAVTESAVSNATVHISRGDDFFMYYKPLVTELYKNMSGIQQFQILTMERSKPGVMQCPKGPDSGVVEQDLHRKIDGVLTEGSKVKRVFANFLTALLLPPINAEKVPTPCIPLRHRSKEMSLKRRSKCDESTELQWQWLQGKNQDRRGREEVERETTDTGNKKRKISNKE